ncbi:hypothetical protein [Mumia sp. DW29H23]|uniref:hypothetical protein n=1 Tax=Mumia sp. DW29H23 TaxID=3421241 RepID=UPI003D686CC9
MGREHYNTWTRYRAVLTSPSLYEIAAGLDYEHPVGRPRIHPIYVLLAYGALARIARSGIRVQLDLAEPHTWDAARTLMTQAIARHRLDVPPPPVSPPTWEHWRWFRDHHLATDDGLGQLARIFTPTAVATAHRIGLLHVDGPGSLTHPDPTRTVYGDGTLVRPIYQPPETVQLDNDDGSTSLGYPDPATGQLSDTPHRRYDPDLREHHGQLGPVLTHGYVCWHARGPRPYQRVDLAAAHIPEPGAEAATALRLLRDVYRAAGSGIQAVVYDGAFRGTHIDHVMTTYGYLVLAKQAKDAATDTATQLVQTPSGRRARSHPLGILTHTLPNGHECGHTLATVGGRVAEIGLDEAGDPVLVALLERSSVKRSRRTDGHFHFNVGYTIGCPQASFTTWLSPHATSADAQRPEYLRVIPVGDPDADRLLGIRSDAESFHSNYKRSLLVNRAMSLGWRRGLVDLYSYAIVNNALTEHRAAREREHGREPDHGLQARRTA